MKRDRAGRRRIGEWAAAVAVAVAIALYLARHRPLLSELPRLWEALL